MSKEKTKQVAKAQSRTESGRAYRSRTLLGILALVAVVVVLIMYLFLPKLLGNTKTIVVAKTDIPKGTLILENMLEIKEYTGELINPYYITELAEAVGKYSQEDIMVDDFVLASKIGTVMPYYDDYLYDIPVGKEAISISIKNFAAGMSNKLRPGDIVSVYSVIPTLDSDENKVEAAYFAELQYVKVLATTQPTGEDVDNGETKVNEDGSTTDNATVTLLVGPRQAQILAGLETQGTIHLALVYRGLPETADNYLAQQELIINPPVIEEVPTEETPAEETNEE